MSFSIRIIVALLTGSVTSFAQTTLPATAPTGITASQLPSANPPLDARTAAIQWDGHLLQVSGNGEGLNQTLAAIARLTGLHVTGSAPDDMLYGSYGPAPLTDILAQMFDGLQVNLLFVDGNGSRPAELTLTSRNGGPTPPNLSAMHQDAANPLPSMHQPGPNGGVPPGRQGEQPAGFARRPPPFGGQSASDPSSSQGTDPSADSGNSGSPNGVKTPQEVFEQLQRLRNAAAAKQ